MSHSQITCKINRWEIMKGKLRQNQREATQSISVYISIYRSSFILIFKPTKSCKYNFWMKGTGKIRQCWYNTQKKKIYYSTKRGQLVTHEQILPSWPSSRLGETEIQLTQQKRRGFRNKNPLAKLVFIAFPNWQKVTSALQTNKNCCAFSFPHRWSGSLLIIRLSVDCATQHSTGHLIHNIKTVDI